MILKSIKYSQYVGTDQEWSLEKFTLGKINLMVGKNAIGKTRTLNVINALANLVSGERKFNLNSGNFIFSFSNEKEVVEYCLKCENLKIIKEQLIINGHSLLKRGDGGKGDIRAEQLDKTMKFQVPENELACVARRDSVQHPFFENLYLWGKSTFYYLFGTQLGKDQLCIFTDGKIGEKLNIKETTNVVAFFKKGFKKYGKDFVKTIKDEMALIGYKIDSINVGEVKAINIAGNQVEGIYVKEKDLNDNTSQIEMSQGMFRALSLIIQLNFAQLEGKPSLVLIDDIGEGLDYDRSSALIKLLIEKAENSSVQLIMSTNDRYVMNNVPLKYWSVIQRTGGKCRIFNYENHKKIFDDFEFTGLANFNFLSSDFYLKGFDAE